ncbi:MAG: chromate transporter [Bacillota bacterium]|nr:chromate transporter [Bacillota bacterium]
MIAKLVVSFLKIGLFAFGGGYAMIPLMQRELVSERGWLTVDRFMDVMALSEMTPGPVAINAATLIGFRQAGVWGAAAATAAVVAPSVVIVWTLARIVKHRVDSAWLQAVLKGLRPLVVGLVSLAALTVGRVSLVDWPSVGLAVATLGVVRFLRLHPVIAILGAGVVRTILP